MDEFSEILARAMDRPRQLSRADLAFLLSRETPDDCARLYQAAYDLKARLIGRLVSIRGLIELGNHCAKNCFYCGIRAGNPHVARYRLSPDEVVRLATEAVPRGYASIVLQSGEIESEEQTTFIENCLHQLRPLNLGITLSLGEQSDAVYQRWFEAGATRYLLRIESATPEIYARLHPASHSFTRRVACLRSLRRIGYQVGTGVMCALPAQTADDLARDVLFFGEIDADMIGMGPYLPHPDTPLGASSAAQTLSAAERLRLGLNLIATTRLYLHDVNIAATTTLQALADDGREQGLLAGANVLMPNLTDTRYRSNYQLYAGKPASDESADAAQKALDTRLAQLGEKIAYHTRGDSRHFFARTHTPPPSD